MPYVEGFGTYPFGEEWLFDAVLRSYLPVLEVADRLTMTVTPVLADQLEAPGVGERVIAFGDEFRRGSALLDAEEDEPGFRAACLAEAGRYERSLERLRDVDGDVLELFRDAHDAGRIALMTSGATHAVLPLVATYAGRRLQLDAGLRSHRRRFGEPEGFWLPECAYEPGLERLLGERGIRCELVHVSGSVEATPRLGLADAIVDLVSTGSTMDANGLRPLGTLLASQAVLVGGRDAIEERRDLVDRLELMLSGVVAARRRRYVMLNARVDDLPAIRAVLPGMGAPSVLQLADEGQIAIHAAVDAGEIWSLLPRLKEAGGTSILVLPVERLVP
jgi:ATP phosphoribosyltransferase-like protein